MTDDFTDNEKEVIEYWIEHIMRTTKEAEDALYAVCPLCYNAGIIKESTFFCICPNGITKRRNFEETVGTISRGGNS